MQIFITGTDTNIGKTLISSWICLHTGYEYFKPIQAGSIESTDRELVKTLSDSKTNPESYIFKSPSSPHIASILEQKTIDIEKIKLPTSSNLIVEGAGGVLVPINTEFFMVDLIKKLNLPVILVVNPKLGAINHTLLSIEALRNRDIKILGVIFSGKTYQGCYDIATFGGAEILAELPYLDKITKDVLAKIPLSFKLQNILRGKECN